MLIRKLKLAGFKSFVEPAELRIEPGLTGVVGPNGCGKSNLLEAIRWVMGETSAKSMRSGGMDDVIFAGTAQRPPRDFAEVVLHASDAEGEELQVTRRIERGSGSAYRVNGRDVRAKDVALVFADAATGAHSPSLVSQGKIAAVIAAKPAEQRMMLEEAAGIACLHVRRRDAEGRRRQTEANQAERYKALTEKIQHAEARLVFARWRDAAAAADAARAQAKDASARVDAAQAAAQAAQKAQQAAAEKLAEVREELADRRDDASAHGHRMASLTSQLEAAEQRLADLDRQRQRLEEDRGEADRMTTDAAEALRKLAQDLAAGEAALGEDERRRPRFERDAEDAERAGRAAELALAKATADHAGVEAEWRIAEAEVAQAEARLARLEGEARRLAEQRAALGAQDDPDQTVVTAQATADNAGRVLARTREVLGEGQARKERLAAVRDETASALATSRAELAG